MTLRSFCYRFMIVSEQLVLLILQLWSNIVSRFIYSVNPRYSTLNSKMVVCPYLVTPKYLFYLLTSYGVILIIALLVDCS